MKTEEPEYTLLGFPVEKKHIVLFIFGFLFLICLFGSFYTIRAGERGIVLTFGNPTMIPVTEGLHIKVPFIQSVVKMDIKTQKYEADASAASKDLQTVTSKIATNYHLESSSVPIIYKEIGLDYTVRVIQPMEQEVVKATTAKFTAEELITKREEVRIEIKNTLHERLIQKGIIVEEVSITNFDFSPEFNKAIEMKVTAEQNALAAKNKLSQVEYEAQAIKMQREQLSSTYLRFKELELQSKALDKWDGKLPQVTGGAIPFIGLSGVSNFTT